MKVKCHLYNGIEISLRFLPPSQNESRNLTFSTKRSHLYDDNSHEEVSFLQKANLIHSVFVSFYLYIYFHIRSDLCTVSEEEEAQSHKRWVTRLNDLGGWFHSSSFPRLSSRSEVLRAWFIVTTAKAINLGNLCPLDFLFLNSPIRNQPPESKEGAENCNRQQRILFYSRWFLI